MLHYRWYQLQIIRNYSVVGKVMAA